MGYDVLESPQEILQTIKDAGYDGADLPGNPQRVDAAELRRIVESVGLEVPEVLGAWAYFHAGEDRNMAGGDEQTRRQGIDYAKRGVDLAADLAADLGAVYFQLCAAQPPEHEFPFPKQPIATLRDNFREAVVEICEHAQQRGITILFEPLTPYEAYPGVLTTIDEALQFIEDLEFDNLGLQPDIYHMNVSEASICDALRAAGRHIQVVHTNETNHRQLGTGHADYSAIMRTLKEIEFDGWLSTYLPLQSQDVAGLATGYGWSTGSMDASTVTRPPLRPVLEEQLQFLKEKAAEAGF